MAAENLREEITGTIDDLINDYGDMFFESLGEKFFHFLEKLEK